MTDNRSALERLAPVVVVCAAMFGAGCFHRAVETPPPLSQAPTREVIAGPAGLPQQAIPMSPTASLPEAPEPYVTLTMADAPVRLVLQRLAELGNLDLIVPASITRTISVQYVHVPVSVALKDVLSRSGLRLGTSTLASLPFDTVTVFYHLPANADSMSSDAIMRRFGVSRAVADLIVQSRRRP